MKEISYDIRLNHHFICIPLLREHSYLNDRGKKRTCFDFRKTKSFLGLSLHQLGDIQYNLLFRFLFKKFAEACVLA